MAAESGPGTGQPIERSRRPDGRRSLLAALAIPAVLVALMGARTLSTLLAHHTAAPTQPAPRRDAGLAADPDHHEILLLGGESSTGPLDDTWTWDGSTWTRQRPPVRPPAFRNPVLLYDHSRHRVDLLSAMSEDDGGSNLISPYTDLWTWNGQTWHKDATDWLPSSPATTARLITWDAARAELLLVQPVSTMTTHCAPPPTPIRTTRPGGPLSLLPCMLEPETHLHAWTWDGAHWTDHGEQVVDQLMTSPLLAADAASGKVALLARPPTNEGCATGAAGASTLTEPSPALLASDVVPQVGCTNSPRQPDHSCSGVLSDVGTEQWLWDGATWRQAAAAGLPCGFDGRQLVTDPSTRHLLVRGASAMFRWIGSRWLHISAPPALAVRDGDTMAADPEHHQVALFGGEASQGDAADLWTWDGHAWTDRGGTPLPTPPPSPHPSPSAVLPAGLAASRRIGRTG